MTPTIGEQLETAMQRLRVRMDRHFRRVYVVLGLLLAAILVLHWLAPGR